MTDKQPEALRLATALTEHVEYYGDGFSEEQGCLAAAELLRLHEANQVMQKTFNAAIDFAIEQGLEASEFLSAWREGDTTEWPEFGQAIAKEEQHRSNQGMK